MIEAKWRLFEAVAGAGVYVLVVRLLVGSRRSRAEARRFVEWLADPVEGAKMAAWLEANPVLPGDLDGLDCLVDERTNARLTSALRTVIAYQRRDGREAA